MSSSDDLAKNNNEEIKKTLKDLSEEKNSSDQK